MTAAPPASPGAGRPRGGRALYRFSVVVVAVTLVLIKLGALVTSTGSGMAYPDWPLAGGSLVPADMLEDPAKLFEHSHRLAATVVGLAILALTVWIGRVEPRAWLRRLAILVLGLVCVQGVVGGFGVLGDLPWATSVTHGVIAQVIFCLLALIAFALSPAWTPRAPAPADRVRRARRLAAFSLALVFLQLVAGAVLRHTNLPGLLALHIAMAMVVGFAILITALYCGTRFHAVPGFSALGRLVLAVLITQLVLGFVTLMIRRVKDPSNVEHLGRSVIVSAHVVVGALLFLSAALLLYKALRNLAPASPRR